VFLLICVGCALFFGAGASQATEVVGCDPEGNQLQLNICATEALEVADTELNKTYNTTLARLTNEQQKMLWREQRSWLKWRDSRCKESTKVDEGGSIWPLEFKYCLRSLTEHRTKELSQSYANPPLKEPRR
jgi:uncharacterized protein YecT (DUF1311 family)